MSEPEPRPPMVPAMKADAAMPPADYMLPTTLADAMKLAEIIAKSSFVPKDFRDKVGDVFCAIQFGREVGLPALQALQGIAVINGRPSLWGDAALAVVEASGKLENFVETLEGEGDAMVARCMAKRRGRAALIEHTFSVADAKAAGLLNKDGPWKQYRPRMLQMRARAFVLRDGFSDVLKGLSIREEAQDIEITAEPAPPTIRQPAAIAGPATDATKPVETSAGATEVSSSSAEPVFNPRDVADLDPDTPTRTLLVEAERTALIADAASRGFTFVEIKKFLEQYSATTTAIPIGVAAKLRAWIAERKA